MLSSLSGIDRLDGTPQWSTVYKILHGIFLSRIFFYYYLDYYYLRMRCFLFNHKIEKHRKTTYLFSCLYHCL